MFGSIDGGGGFYCLSGNITNEEVITYMKTNNIEIHEYKYSNENVNTVIFNTKCRLCGCYGDYSEENKKIDKMKNGLIEMLKNHENNVSLNSLKEQNWHGELACAKVTNLYNNEILIYYGLCSYESCSIICDYGIFDEKNNKIVSITNHLEKKNERHWISKLFDTMPKNSKKDILDCIEKNQHVENNLNDKNFDEAKKKVSNWSC